MKQIELSESEVLQIPINALRPYQTIALKEALTTLSGGHDAVLQLPTGTGKTFVYLPIAVAAASKEYRVCALVATNLILDQVKNKYLPFFKRPVEPLIAKGIEHYTCQMTHDRADYSTCTREQRQNVCMDLYPECPVVRTNREFEDRCLILTNYHKFLSTPTSKGFDLIIIDDSHGFENALDDKFQNRIAHYQVDRIFQDHDSSKDVIADVSGNFLDIFDDVLRTLPPNELTRRVPDDYVKQIADIKNVKDLQAQAKSLASLDDRSMCYELFYFIKSCQNPTLHTFYIAKDYYNKDNPSEAAMIARMSDKSQESLVRFLMRDASVMFVSATPGDVKTHASYCTHRDYSDGSLAVIPHSEHPDLRNWFDGLHVLEIKDSGVDLQDQIEEGVKVAIDIIGQTSGKTLLLFKNYRDQRKAQRTLVGGLRRAVTFIDDSYDTETVQELVDKADIIMATASSRLWEGTDIPDLRLEIIFSLPFIRPPVYLDSRKGWPLVQRKMLVRLQQGIGRLIRRENAVGVCIILDSRMKKYNASPHFSGAYGQRVSRVALIDLPDVTRSAMEG